MDLDDSFPDWLARARAGDQAAAAAIHHRFVHRLIDLARSRLDTGIRRKEDPEDVVQSVFKSFFARNANGRFQLNGWNKLWSLLATITVLKCAERGRKYQTQKRGVGREAVISPDDPSSHWELFAREPTADDLAALDETVRQWMEGMSPKEREILALLQERKNDKEIAKLVALSERSVRSVRSRHEKRLEMMLNECSS